MAQHDRAPKPAVSSNGQEIQHVSCVACGYGLAAAFFTPEPLPLATLGWPESAEEARAMARLPLSFVSCLSCGHVWNSEFRYADVPYARNPNRMFNKGNGWSDFLAARRDQLIAELPNGGTVVDIGCGEGHFLRALARARPDGRYLGFDPNGAMEDGGLVELRRELFHPERHLSELRPSVIVMRHVLEHFENPRAFLQSLDFCAAAEDLVVALYAEVPCIDRVPETGRLSDFYYEHSSQFSSRSFAAMLANVARQVDFVETGYDGEMVYGLCHLGGTPERTEQAEIAAAFHSHSRQARATIAGQLDRLCADGKGVAIWGGTGKAAAFINYYGADAARFPLVVDSDREKCGSFVPGSGQEIQPRGVLLSQPPEAVIIPMAWRAKDVVEEMEAAGVFVSQVLIEHDGRLVDFLTGEHPYERPLPAAKATARDAKASRRLPDEIALRPRRWALAG